jgi:hypothetical protein
MTRRMPIGIQDFKTIRTGNYGYVNKTIWKILFENA